VIAVDVPAHVGLGVANSLPLLMALAHALVLPPLNDDPLAFAPIHHLIVMVSYVPSGPGLSRRRIWRQSRDSRPHLVSKVGSR
jgi:hypothetical protein